MDLQTWKPIDQLAKIRDAWTPAGDWFESDDDLVLVLDAPGLDINSLEIAHDASEINIQGSRETQSYGTGLSLERPMGSFERSFELPRAVEAGSAVAQYRAGQLEVRFSKLSRTITIEPGTPQP
jgi:HSP20 family protein